jgi:aspartate aminotransferase
MSRQPKLSDRAQLMPASPIRKLVGFADEAKKRGVKVYHLNIGQPDIPTPEEFMNALRGFQSQVLEYGHSKGSLPYRKRLVEYYKRHEIELDPEDIAVTAGGSEAIIFAMLAVCATGDEILVPEPFYTNYMGFSIMADVKLVPISTKAESGYHLPPRKEIEERITSRTRAIIVCSPNNPTGTVFTRHEMETVGEIAEKHDLFILGDEAYREFIYEGRHTSVMHIKGAEQRTILLDSISKRYSACGARIGCLVSKNNEIMQVALKFGQARLCPATAEQVAAQACVDVGDVYFKAIREEYWKRRDVVCDALAKMEGVICRKPHGAFYVMAKLPITDTDDFAKWLLTDFHVEKRTTMVAPGAGFYATPGMGKDEVRIAYVLNADALHEAMEIFAAGLNKYREDRELSPARLPIVC